MKIKGLQGSRLEWAAREVEGLQKEDLFSGLVRSYQTNEPTKEGEAGQEVEGRLQRSSSGNSKEDWF